MGVHLSLVMFNSKDFFSFFNFLLAPRTTWWKSLSKYLLVFASYCSTGRHSPCFSQLFDFSFVFLLCFILHEQIILHNIIMNKIIIVHSIIINEIIIAWNSHFKWNNHLFHDPPFIGYDPFVGICDFIYWLIFVACFKYIYLSNKG